MIRKRTWVVWLVVLLPLGGCGEEQKDADPFEVVAPGGGKPPGIRAAPRWERVVAFAGSGPATRTVEIASRAIQWRVRWRCESGRLSVTVTPAPRSGSGRAEGRCPGKRGATWADTGKRQLAVEATGRWKMVVEQQVDTPLHEPALPAMRASGAPVATGRFYGVERKGRGDAELYRLRGGRLALRLRDFATAANDDLEVWVTGASKPRNTKQAFRAPRTVIGEIKSTIGDQNYLLPRNVDRRTLDSVVIWCRPVQIAYAAAPLRR